MKKDDKLLVNSKIYKQPNVEFLCAEDLSVVSIATSCLTGELQSSELNVSCGIQL